jgi:DNA segregation ATPase FtsK/SpoIIIE-like protein
MLLILKRRAKNRLLSWLSYLDGRFDPMFLQVLALVIRKKNASVSHAQRNFLLPYRRTCRIFEALEEMGIVSTCNESNWRLYTGP